MTLLAPIPGRQRFDQNQLRPHLPLYVDFTRGLTAALSGQPAEYERTGTQTVTGRFGGTFDVEEDRIPLTWADALGYEQDDGELSYAFYEPVVAPMMVAWDGVLVATTSDAVLWRIGADDSTDSFFELRKVGGAATLRAIYSNGDGDTSVSELTNVTLGSRIYAVAELAEDGANVKARLRVRTTSGQYVVGSFGTQRSLVATWDDGTMHVMSLAGANELPSVCYRLLAQFGTSNINDLPWGW